MQPTCNTRATHVQHTCNTTCNTTTFPVNLQSKWLSAHFRRPKATSKGKGANFTPSGENHGNLQQKCSCCTLCCTCVARVLHVCCTSVAWKFPINCVDHRKTCQDTSLKPSKRKTGPYPCSVPKDIPHAVAIESGEVFLDVSCKHNRFFGRFMQT